MRPTTRRLWPSPIIIGLTYRMPHAFFPSLIRRLFPTVAWLGLLSCSGGDATAPVKSPPPVPPQATRVVVTPETSTLAPGASITLSAQPVSAAGSPVSATVSWTTSAPAVASVDASGRVSAIATGNATITATTGSASGTATIAVIVPVASITLSTDTATLRTGDLRSFTATPRDAAGAALTDRPVQWSSSSAAVATVSTTGVVTALSPGRTTITASIGAIAARATVTVLAPVASLVLSPDSLVIIPGEARPFIATVQDAGGAALGGRLINWSSSSPTIASVSNSGTVTGITAGRAVIVASSEGRADTAAVRVVIPESRLVFDRAPSQIRPGFGLGLVVRATRTGVDTLRTFNGPITIQDESGANTLLGTTTVVARNGVAQFDELAFVAAGAYRLRATASMLSPASSGAIVVAATSTLPPITVGSIQRTTLTVGISGSSRYRIPVTLRDSAGNAVGPTAVSVAIARGPGAIVSGATTVTTVNGAATFDLVMQGTSSVDLEFSAPGFQSKVQAIESPVPSQTNLFLQRFAGDSVVAVGGRITLSATLSHSALATAPVHATTYELSWNPAQLALSSDSATTGASYTINRTMLPEGVLRVTVAGSGAIAPLSASVLLHRFTLVVREGATGTQQLRLTALTFLGPSGESLAPRRTSDTSFRVP